MLHGNKIPSVLFLAPSRILSPGALSTDDALKQRNILESVKRRTKCTYLLSLSPLRHSFKDRLWIAWDIKDCHCSWTEAASPDDGLEKICFGKYSPRWEITLLDFFSSLDDTLRYQFLLPCPLRHWTLRSHFVVLMTCFTDEFLI